MKRFLKICLVVVFTFMMNNAVMAKEVDHFKSKVDTEVNIKDDVNGSVAAIGDTTEVSGKADGISFIIGNKTSFTGNSEYVAAIGNSLEIKGVVSKDAFIAGNIIEITNKADLQRDVIIVGADVEISGKVGRNVSIYGTNIKLKGAEIAGNVKVYGTNLNVDKDTVINGNLSYPEDAIVEVSDEAVKGEVIKTDAIQKNNESFMTLLMGKFWSFMSLLLVFAVLSLVSSKLFVRVQKEYDKFDFNKGLETFTKGLMFLILVPFIIVILFLMSIGIPLALILLALYFVTMYLSTIFTGYLLGYKLWQKFFDKDINMLVVGIFGLAILFILSLIPGISFVISALSLVIGIGIIYDVIFKKIGSK